MRWPPGACIGSYEIVAKIGEGGMGEVYRARDPRLNRDVAIKVLGEDVAANAERLKRFEREAQLLASLNHPNIAHLYGVEASAGGGAIVMELVDGPTLAELIAERTAGAIEIADALNIARQIADALEAAHDLGIIHRDLKPANVKVRPDGVVKLLDFGLAKVLGDESDSDRAHSPTITAATRAGVILGTAAYMSPEQAAGKPADRRSDVWAFGVVLMEMLTGRPLFDGETVSHVLAGVLKTDPDFSTLPAATPPAVRKLLRRCLEKDRRRRLADASVLRLEIEDLVAGRTTAEITVTSARTSSAIARWLPWVVAGLTTIAALFAWASWRTPEAAARTPIRVTAELGADVLLSGLVAGSGVAISDDGKTLAFSGRSRGSDVGQLYVRPLSQPDARAIRGTDGAAGAFFSPDGKWIAFFADGKLKKASTDGTAVVNICDAPAGRGGDWASDGTIVFQPRGAPFASGKLLSVHDSGGPTTTVVSTDSGILRWPQVLPGNRGVLYSAGRIAAGQTGQFDDGDLVVKTPSGLPKIVHQGGYYGRYIASGHLLFMHAESLFAAPFDLDRLELMGDPVPVLKGIRSHAINGNAQFAVSDDGTFVYVAGPGESGRAPAPVQWMSHAGVMTPLYATPALWGTPVFSPDGDRLAMTMDLSLPDQTIGIYDWTRDIFSRLSLDKATALRPVWSPDGQWIAYGSSRREDKVANLYVRRADGTGQPVRLTTSAIPQLPDAWHPSSKFLIFHEGASSGTSQSLSALPMEADAVNGWKAGQPTVLVGGPSVKAFADFTLDGKWMAFVSLELNQPDVYVQSFPDGNGRTKISSRGGTWPQWSKTKNQLLYKSGGTVMSANYTVDGQTFKAEKPVPWSTTTIEEPPLTALGGGWALHPDGERIATAAALPPATPLVFDRIGIIVNFFEELRRLAPLK